jgi:hypothetical protein
MSYYLADGGHVLISGSTGARDDYGGKTVLANWWMDNLVQKGHRDVALFLNPKRHGFIEGQTVHTVKGLAESYRAGNRVFDVRDTQPDKWVNFLLSLGRDAVVVFDEAQTYGDAEGLNDTLAMYGNRDDGSIRGLVITQRPWNLSEELRANMPVKVWVGPITNEGRRFFETEQMGTVADRLEGAMKPYHWAVTDAGELQEVNEPVPEGYA